MPILLTVAQGICPPCGASAGQHGAATSRIRESQCCEALPRRTYVCQGAWEASPTEWIPSRDRELRDLGQPRTALQGEPHLRFPRRGIGGDDQRQPVEI